MYVVDIEKIEGYKGPYEALEHRQVASGFAQFEIVYGKVGKGGVSSMHTHPDSEKFQFVLEGELEVKNNQGEIFRVPAGSGILIQTGEEHEGLNVYDGTTRFLVVYAPPRSDADKTKKRH